ncbi:MAG: WD40 repeat domain-containing protein [Bacteroidota bacterium]
MKTNTLKIAFIPMLSFLVTFFNIAVSQTINAEYERFHATDTKYIHSGMAISPDKSLIALTTTQSYPLYIYDITGRRVVRQFDVGNWYAGSRVTWSSEGRYLLLQQLYYIDFASNKDRQVNFEIIDAVTGRRILRLDKYHDVKITPDEKYAVALTGSKIEIKDLSDGNNVRSFSVYNATNSLCLSPDGKYIAVSERPGDQLLNQDPQFRKNKKGLKFTKKYKQIISVYKTDDFSPVATINEYYDNIFRLEWSSDGKYIFCLSIPHLKAATATSGRQNFISLIDAERFQSTRTVFPSNSNYEPDFRLSHDGKSMGVVSWGKFPELRVHDFATGQVVHRFEMSSRIMEGVNKLDFPTDGKVFIEFLPGDKSMLATFGNQLLLWHFLLE